MAEKLAAAKSQRPSQVEETGDVPQLAVYHICRVCLRPRSARYHREHPIPIGALPPPPSDICRRCRIRPADERTAAGDFIEEARSNNIRIGVASFVPGDHYISNEDTQRRRAYRLLDDDDWEELAPPSSALSLDSTVRSSEISAVPPIVRTQNDVIYRHVRSPASPKPLSTPRPYPFIPPPPPPPSSSDDSSTSRSIVPRGKPSYKTIIIPPVPPTEAELPVPVRTERATETTVEIRRIGRGSPPTKMSPIVDARDRPPLHTKATESDIRRLAREEIVRYRRAERKLETHKDPFAHGKMVEVQRVPIDRHIKSEKSTSAERVEESSKAVRRKDSFLAAVEVQSGEARATSGGISSTKATAGTEIRTETSVNLPKRVSELQQSYKRQERSEARSNTPQPATSEARSRGSATGSSIASSDKTPAGGRDKAVVARAEKGHSKDSKAASRGPPDDREYQYTRRTVVPADEIIPSPHNNNTHYETSEYLRRKVVPQKSMAALGEVRDRTATASKQCRSDASSRVHFSKKLDVSPTPPDSEASSSEFRYFAVQGKTTDGRIRQAEPGRPRQSHVQPEARAGRLDRSAYLSEHVFSESPSRELQQQSSKARERAGYGPYVGHEKRSASVDVEDGSTVSSTSWSGIGYARREERRGLR